MKVKFVHHDLTACFHFILVVRSYHVNMRKLIIGLMFEDEWTPISNENDISIKHSIDVSFNHGSLIILCG